MFDGVTILVLVLEHNLSTLEELEDHIMDIKAVAATHSVYHLTLTTLNTNLNLDLSDITYIFTSS